MTARNFGAEEAYRVGFVNHIAATKDEAVQHAMRLATLLASKSPVAVQGSKNFLDWSRDHNVADGELTIQVVTKSADDLLRAQVYGRLERWSATN